MDTTDVEIEFDEKGVCSHCQLYENTQKKLYFPNKEGKKKLDIMIQKIKDSGTSNSYDCVIGLSGGVDSSYLAYILKKEYPELRILAIHVDGGWNSELAVNNIENIVKKLDIDLYTRVIDWEEMKDLQLAYLKSSLANQDVPQDHAFFATLYEQALKYNIKYFLTGYNLATESILPSSWGYNAMDSIQIKEIHKIFGTKKLKNYTLLSFFQKHIYYPYIRKFQIIAPLNYLPYNKNEAKKIISEKLGWRDYGGKHHESIFTKFFQSYYLPKKFGYDKRKAHLSSLIVSGQLSRNDALDILKTPLYNADELKNDKEFISKKLGIKTDELEKLIALPNKNFSDYKSERQLVILIKKILKLLKVKL